VPVWRSARVGEEPVGFEAQVDGVALPLRGALVAALDLHGVELGEGGVGRVDDRDPAVGDDRQVGALVVGEAGGGAGGEVARAGGLGDVGTWKVPRTKSAPIGATRGSPRAVAAARATVSAPSRRSTSWSADSDRSGISNALRRNGPAASMLASMSACRRSRSPGDSRISAR
jgi:hypothetical protein